MRTALISDLHLGTRFGSDLLRRPGVRARLFARLAEADRVVLLGDALELRQGPVGEALEAAAPFLFELGQALAGRPLVVVPGNHDHQLAAGLLARARLRENGGSLGLEERARAEEGEPLATFARHLGPSVDLTLAYPGVWLRPDVYATHGHYLDAHLTVPRIECLAVAGVRRLVGLPRGAEEGPADYERVLSPVYALAYELAQAASEGGAKATTNISARVWRRLDARSAGGRRDLVGRALGSVGLPAAVGALNALGLGPFSAELTGDELRRAGLAAMEAVTERLVPGARHVIFGHTHRPGPLDGEGGFELASGGGLTNCGSWIHDPALGDPPQPENPYYPGVVVWLEEAGPPGLERVLEPADLDPSEGEGA